VQWLSNISEADAGRPPLSNTGNTVRIVENWEAPKDPEASSRTIHVYTNAPLGEKAFASGSCLSDRSRLTPLLSLFLTSRLSLVRFDSFPRAERRSCWATSARWQLRERTSYVSSKVCAGQANRQSAGF